MFRRTQLSKFRQQVPAILPSLLSCDFRNLERDLSKFGWNPKGFPVLKIKRNHAESRGDGNAASVRRQVAYEIKA